jgi:hypothetical protein
MEGVRDQWFRPVDELGLWHAVAKSIAASAAMAVNFFIMLMVGKPQR